MGDTFAVKKMILVIETQKLLVIIDWYAIE